MRGIATVLIFFAAAVCSSVADDLRKYEHWVTGDVLLENGNLLFRTDKPVKENSRRDIVALAAVEEGAKVLIPLYQRAAEKHMKLRLYGAFIPTPKNVHGRNLPTMAFLTWKAHLPSEPDDLPARSKLMIRPEDTIKDNELLLHHK
jgi:hypothetical protein